MEDSHFFLKMGEFSVKCSINIFISKNAYIAPPPLVYGLYACENVDNCEIE